MKYVIKRYGFPVIYPDDLPTKEIADKELLRLETLRKENNKKHKEWTYCGRGSAFMKPDGDETPYVLEELI